MDEDLRRMLRGGTAARCARFASRRPAPRCSLFVPFASPIGDAKFHFVAMQTHLKSR